MPDSFFYIGNLGFEGYSYNIHYVLGQDDWMFYARTMEGTLVYYVSEVDWHWDEAPHKGDCWNSETGLNCDGETKFTCRRDCLFMLGYVWEHANELPWQECDYDTDGTYLGWPPEKDRDFILNSRDRYLPYAPPIQEPRVNQFHVYPDNCRPIAIDAFRWLIASPARKRP